MDLDVFKVLLVIGTGIFAGFVNAVAGGGSLLTLPVLIIFLGLPSTVANATNRVAILLGAVSSTAGFRSKGVSSFPYGLWIGLSATLGAILGAWIAIDIKTELFNRILAILMVLIVLQMIFKSKNRESGEENMSKKRQWLGIFVFFFIGIYGGFIQAGVGFIIMAALTNINHFSLAKTNATKVFSVLIYTTAAVIVFALNDMINWVYGLTLAVGNVTGAWLGSRWSVDRGEVWVRRILIVMVIAFAVKLWLL